MEKRQLEVQIMYSSSPFQILKEYFLKFALGEAIMYLGKGP